MLLIDLEEEDYSVFLLGVNNTPVLEVSDIYHCFVEVDTQA